MMKRTLLLFLISTLCACGYHLRGAMDVPEIMHHVHVSSASPQLLNGFRDSFKTAGVNLKEKPEAGGVVINIVNERFDRRTLSLSSTGKANEFELLYTLEFELLTADNKVILPRQSVDINRDYFNDQQDIMGKGNEETQIRLEMYQQAARAVIDRGMALMNK